MASYDNYNTVSYDSSSASTLPAASRQDHFAEPTGYYGRNHLAGHLQDHQFYQHHNPHGQMQMQVERWYPFPPGTDPNVVRCFEMVDRDRSGYIDENELQKALSSGYQRFKLRTVRLLMFLFGNPSGAFLRIGPREFVALWTCLGRWRAIFERFDRDRSGKMDLIELKDALYSLGYAIPPSVFQVLISRYSDESSRKFELDFDSFVECGMIVKGLTERFKDKDKQYTGTATLTYDAFLSMVIPFLVPY